MTGPELLGARQQRLCWRASPLSQTAMRPDWGLEPPLRARVMTTWREAWFDFVAIKALSMSSDSAYGSTDRPCAALSASQSAKWSHCALLLGTMGEGFLVWTLQSRCIDSHVSDLQQLTDNTCCRPCAQACYTWPENPVPSQAQACLPRECLRQAESEKQRMSCAPEQPSTPAPQQR